MKLSIDDIYRARTYIWSRAWPPVRIIAGPVAWVMITGSEHAFLPLYPDGDVIIFGMVAIQDQSRHPDYLAVEFANGARLPVAEV